MQQKKLEIRTENIKTTCSQLYFSFNFGWYSIQLDFWLKTGWEVGASLANHQKLPKKVQSDKHLLTKSKYIQTQENLITVDIGGQRHNKFEYVDFPKQ